MNSHEGASSDRHEQPFLEAIIKKLGDLSVLLTTSMSIRQKQIGGLAISGVGGGLYENEKNLDNILFARGGNFKAVRVNLIKSGKANSRPPMSERQKKLRRRKRKRK
jgi:hypothetical protein